MSVNGDLQIVQVSVAAVDPNPWNPNQQTEIVARATRESIQHYGFVEPVAVRVHPDDPARYQIINGEHRWAEAGPLGYETIPAVILDVSEEEAKKLTIVLNETHGDADVVLLGQLLADIKALVDDESFPVALPYSTAELEHLLALGAEDWDQYRSEPPGDLSTGDPLFEMTLTMQPKVGERFVRHLDILRKEWDLGADTGASDVVVEVVKRAALEANQGKRKQKTAA